MEIVEIKQKLTIQTVLNYYHHKADKNHRLHCPFHEDKTPSMQVYTKTNTVYCFSANCITNGKSLDVIAFVMQKENCNFHQAALKCVEIINYYEGKVNHIQKPAALTIKYKLTISKESLLENIFTYFKNAVANSKPAQDYLKSRGIDPSKIEVGYNSGQFHLRQSRNETFIQNCVAVGLLKPSGVNTRNPENQAYQVFGKECIVFAMRDKEGKITGLYFRSIYNNEAKHFYLKDSTGLYPCYPNADTKKLIIIESIIDTASLLQIESIAKDYSILATYGTNRLNEEIQTAISELKYLEEIIFAFDSDEAGDKAVIKYANELQKEGVIMSKLTLPNKDVNETLTAHNEQLLIDIIQERKVLPKAIFFSTEAQTEEQAITAATEKPLQQSVIDFEAGKQTINTTNPHKFIFSTNTANYYIKGGIDKHMSKLNITLEIENEKLQSIIKKRRYKIDLYDSKQTEKLIQEAAEELQLYKEALANDIYELTEQLDAYREQQVLQNNNQHTNNMQVRQALSSTAQAIAMALAQNKNVLTLIREKLTQSGIIGEDINKVFLFAIAVSHIQAHPLNALVQGSSGSGKTNILRSIYKTMPEDVKEIYSRISEKMLYNIPQDLFKNKLICFEDIDGLGEEAEYAWRELISGGKLISGVIVRNEQGNNEYKKIQVNGPIASIACTTKGAIYADNMSRLFLIAIDESKAQTKRVNEYQSMQAAGLVNKEAKQNAITELQNYVSILRPYEVHNPHAMRLQLPEDIHDERRLHALYIKFIEIITVLHQYQRKQNEEGLLIATKSDCQQAKDLMFECIMLKMDELDGSLRQFFERLKSYVLAKKKDHYEFSQRELREALHVKKTQLSYYIKELTELEYLQQTSSNNTKGNKYKIQYWDNHRKLREDVKQFMQAQIDQLPEDE